MVETLLLSLGSSQRVSPLGGGTGLTEQVMPTLGSENLVWGEDTPQMLRTQTSCYHLQNYSISQ